MGSIILFTERKCTKMSKRRTPEYVSNIREKRDSLIKPDVMNETIKIIFEECDVKQVPVDVVKIAKQLEFDIFYGRFKSDVVYGAMWDGNKDLKLSGGHTSNRFILVNSNDSKEKQTFTIAHEIGHFMMHCTSEHNFFERYHGDDEQDEQKKKLEDEADFFAANMILPSSLVLGYVMNNKYVGRKRLIKMICEQFNAEEETVERRFNELGLEIL